MDKIFLQSQYYNGDYVIKGSNGWLHFMQQSAIGEWRETILTKELLKELMEIAEKDR